MYQWTDVWMDSCICINTLTLRKLSCMAVLTVKVQTMYLETHLLADYYALYTYMHTNMVQLHGARAV